ncbi:MAG: zinc-dependent peptidase [Bacteroidetes bacterium]|nr:zinc-dependent peptidase [Bacteroidota bacterium]
MIGVLFILLPFLTAIVYGIHSYYTDGDLKQSKFASKQHDFEVLAKSPVIATRYHSIQKYLDSSFEYYKNLPASDKNKFVLRTASFISHVEFIGQQGFAITDEVKISIAACAVQLTFGLEGYLLDNIEFIQVFPSKYYSRLGGTYYKGEYRKNGVLRLSWEDFVKGYHPSTPGVNLGLHEMAHALDVGTLQDQPSDTFFQNYYSRWTAVIQETFTDIQNQQNDTVLRDYAGSNEQEFFAVCVEHFFERPEEFKQNLPKIYDTLAILLNQDPLDKHTSPRLTDIPSLDNVDFSMQNELFHTQFKISRFVRMMVRFDLLIFLIPFLYYNYDSFSSWEFSLAVSLALFLLSFKIFRKTALVKAYDNGLLFTNPFSIRKEHKFSVSNIVSANLETSFSGKKSLEIYYTNGGRFGLKKFYLPSTAENIKQVLSYLKRHDINIYKK